MIIINSNVFPILVREISISFLADSIYSHQKMIAERHSCAFYDKKLWL